MSILVCLVLWPFAQQAGAVAAVENETKPEVLLFMSGHGSKAKADLLLSLAKDQAFTLTNLKTRGKSEQEIARAWSQADLILLDGINPELSKYMFAKYQGHLSTYPQVAVISLGDTDNAAMNQGLADKDRNTIAAYYKHAGRSNYQNMMTYLSHDVFKRSSRVAKPPTPVPDVGLYHYDFPGLLTSDEDAFFAYLNDKNEAAENKQPVIAIAIHRSVIDYEQQQVVDTMIKGLEAKGAKAFAFFFEGNDELLSYTDLLMTEQEGGQGALARSRVNLLINYRSLHYVEKRRQEFAKLGVPVIHALNYSEGDEEKFKADNAGISPSLTPFFLVMPEDTGSVDPSIIAATDKGRKVVMAPQMQALIERAYNHASLAHKNNQDKKVAAFIWNYPPGEKNIGAAFLDVPSSLEQISRAMKAQGYQVEDKTADYFIKAAGQLLRPYYRKEDTSSLIALGLADYLPLKTYLAWFNQLPKEVSQPIVERWGKPEDSAMLSTAAGNKSGKQGQEAQEPAFIIPRMALGNMIVMPQGVRGEDAKEHANLYHSTKTPINHSYLAIYLYARQVFAADAFIHLGTHGSQEWLTGKERGLSVYDAPSLAIGNIPVFYPYIIDNVGEAMQAKRRGRATVISHLTPGFAKAGLYSDVAELNELIANYVMLEQGLSKENTREQIIAKAEKLHIFAAIDLDADKLKSDFNTGISQIQDHLTELAGQSQPLGVHTFGLLPEKAHLLSTTLQMLGDDFAGRAASFERENKLAVSEEDSRDRNQVTKLAALPGYQILKHFLVEQISMDKAPLFSTLDETLKADILQAKKYWSNFAQIAELENLLAALNGQYIGVSHGGDPIRNPQAAPTGRNLIGFNPAKVPSKEAYQAGVTLLEQTLVDHMAKNGKYPQKMAFSLWSLETMRHQGALEAQILHALGVKPKWNQQGNISGIEVIPYSELGRPRIDVVISATGLYRDAFPNVMLWLAEAIDEIAQMKEDNNFVYRHSQALKQSLLEQGKSAPDAEYLSSVRIFSNESGNYGTGLAASSLASDTWDSDAKLANLYLDRMGFAYGKDEKRWSENMADTGLYSQVLSGTEAVVFSRSTNLYALMTNDDPFQYFGGIGLAVRHLDGKTPQMYVSNLRRKDKLKAQTMADFLDQEMRSRYFHPRWISAMQDAGYAGATAILDRMNNMWGWEVMTPEAVRDDQWQEFFEVYVQDKYQLEMEAFFKQSHPEAMAQILERMLEAVRKDYWQADQQTVKEMVQMYTELAATYDVATDNDTFTEYVDAKARGFGLQLLSQALSEARAEAKAQALPSAASQASEQTEQVSGQKLEQQEVNKSEVEQNYWPLYLLLLVFLTGVLRQWFMPRATAIGQRQVEFKQAA
ncbi:cobaltochelatase subunit CobN [Thalassomonas haliotis]|uniref:Cobaltochelatase subunit CobN n=1 Tax=Thalassomonas haliotis TaxID=485448 RepID=A0ABY7VK85_9GAMM|nr:cobaltochelatase subunit CobN [Thalassomonas haliotis]WDE13822.1 cobaltochelatase subunit CobN [Thalassomonas haliotis]